MPTVANLDVKSDGSFEGTLATLNVTAPTLGVACVDASRTFGDPLANPSIVASISKTFRSAVDAVASRPACRCLRAN